MKIKEIMVGIVYPYQLSQYLNGKVELSEVIAIEESDDVEKVKTEALFRLTKQCKEHAHNIIIGVGEGAPTSSDQTQTGSIEGRKRRF